MRYEKPPLTLGQQADLLLGRGLIGDRQELIARLGSVGYYRLSAYWNPFRVRPMPDDGAVSSEFRPGTTLGVVWSRYEFDRGLRLLVLDALERIEVAVRSLISLHHSLSHGQFGYALGPEGTPHLRGEQRERLLTTVREEQSKSKELFATHFFSKYGDSHIYLPLWMAAEVMSFGTLLTLFRGSHGMVQSAVSRVFGVHDTVLLSWLLSLNTIRNICAHHGRLWNRELGVSPKIPERLAEWNVPVRITGDRMFGILTICKWSTDRLNSGNDWGVRLVRLLRANPDVPVQSMGFPTDWERSPIWLPCV